MSLIVVHCCSVCFSQSEYSADRMSDAYKDIPGVRTGSTFFDDGDDQVVGRLDEGEKPEDFGLEEVCVKVAVSCT